MYAWWNWPRNGFLDTPDAPEKQTLLKSPGMWVTSLPESTLPVVHSKMIQHKLQTTYELERPYVPPLLTYFLYYGHIDFIYLFLFFHQ